MHILYFHQHFSTPGGAAGTRSFEMARRLVHHGHQVTMVCGSYVGGCTGLEGPYLGGRREGGVDGFRVIEFDLSYSNSAGLLRRTWLFLRFAVRGIGLAFTERYDRLFATTTPLTAGIPGIFARLFRGKTFIFEVRDLWPGLPRELGVITNPVVLALVSILEWASYRAANRCIALAPGIADGIARRGIPRDRIAIIPNGCDIEIFRSTKIEPWRPTGVGDSDFMAVFTGTHGVANGLDAVIDAASVLRARGRKDVKFVLVGDGKIKPELMRRAEIEGLANVIFHGSVNKGRIAGLLASADLGVQCLKNLPGFYYGTSPNKFFDYIASGLPVLNNYPGWIADLVEEYGCGLVVPPDNARVFADAVERLADDSLARKRMGESAARLASERFDRAKLADRWVEWVTADLR